MSVQHFFEPCVLPLSKGLQQTLLTQLEQRSTSNQFPITLNFRDSTYSAEAGGFHPVEISLQRTQLGKWKILYITDFAYFGSAYPELERNVDFDIASGQAYFSGMGWQDISSFGVRDFYLLWESNFLSYLDMEAYDDIKTT
ncbi:DUF2787 domain-containing protein [Vibrio vulnificus]|uniref:DUF2787 domain-containing protein n=1 Tax=Vibrio vulnificus TaxID=672 RepID=UPI001DAD2367|nr:DUF2787 domain-containing protein [Vibrio vulnificus]EGR1868739.1 DUF2787 domain-containing protein [Vibrio vulnificus]ELS3450400.1 DUF2787 domain-containing protein [Vibrio vulnificus]ELS9098925.1 DUF2787 domain-containing protein [Vibrio vulnificus]MCR9501159.1 DUF2787 domain-containing protein [Vibrio vulnificus]MCU8175181.1 DUF2787 domain-containing protein [Vibrio vulnificus]